MKLVSFIAEGTKGFGVLSGDDEDRIADLSGRWGSLREALGALADGELARVAADAPRIALSDVQLTIPIPDADKYICAGLNFRLHLMEGGMMEVPKHPSIFLRAADTLSAHDEPILKPNWSDEFDYEAELAVVIGKSGRYIPVAEAMDYVAGYTLLMDGSIRDVQMQHSLAAGKNFYKSGSLGPYILTADEVPDPAKIELVGRVNGEERQRAFLSDLLFDIPTLISYASRVLGLTAGDILSVGTPDGVGLGFKPPKWLKEGDVFEVEVKEIGVLRNAVALDPLAH